MNSLNLSGHEGLLRWGYRTAAQLGSWRYTGAGDSGTVTAQIVSSDEFCLEQAPLIAVMPMGRAVWRWAVTSLSINGSTLTFSVARQEG